MLTQRNRDGCGTLLLYSFTAPRVSPWIRYFCIAMAKMSSGIIMMVPAAFNSPHSMPIPLTNDVTVTGNVLVLLPVSTSEKKNSFHEKIKHRIPDAAKPGRVSGKIIFHRIAIDGIHYILIMLTLLLLTKK